MQSEFRGRPNHQQYKINRNHTKKMLTIAMMCFRRRLMSSILCIPKKSNWCFQLSAFNFFCCLLSAYCCCHTEFFLCVVVDDDDDAATSIYKPIVLEPLLLTDDATIPVIISYESKPNPDVIGVLNRARRICRTHSYHRSPAPFVIFLSENLVWIHCCIHPLLVYCVIFGFVSCSCLFYMEYYKLFD